MEKMPNFRLIELMVTIVDRGRGAKVVDLSTEAKATVTLYAQWKPRSYTVELLLAGDDGTMTPLRSIDATFDEPLTLPDEAEGIPDGRVLLGWETLGFGSFYRAGSQAANLCTLGADGTPVGSVPEGERVGKARRL